MLNHLTYRQRCWAFVFGWVSLIYSTLYIVRPICAYLKETTPFSFLVNTLCLMFLMILLCVLLKKSKGLHFSKYFLLAGVLLAYAYGMVTIQFPEEKIHFIEYGILSYFIFQALHIDMPTPQAYSLSFILVSIFGWIDEGIQYILPNRYYQMEDVFLNSISGFLGLLLVYIFKGKTNERLS